MCSEGDIGRRRGEENIEWYKKMGTFAQEVVFKTKVPKGGFKPPSPQ